MKLRNNFIVMLTGLFSCDFTADKLNWTVSELSTLETDVYVWHSRWCMYKWRPLSFEIPKLKAQKLNSYEGKFWQ